MANSLRAAVPQFPASMDVASNLERLTAVIDRLEAGTLAVAPGGALSGYLPERGFVTALDQETIARAINSTRSTVMNEKIHLVAGALLSRSRIRNPSCGRGFSPAILSSGECRPPKALGSSLTSTMPLAAHTVITYSVRPRRIRHGAC